MTASFSLPSKHFTSVKKQSHPELNSNNNRRLRPTLKNPYKDCSCGRVHSAREPCGNFSEASESEDNPRSTINMPPKKRTRAETDFKEHTSIKRTTKKDKAEIIEPEFQCDCGYGHDSVVECKRAKAEQIHSEIGTSIIIGSTAMITVAVGASGREQTFLIHKELLAFHSGYFANLFARPLAKTPGDKIEKTLDIETVKMNGNKVCLQGTPLPGFLTLETPSMGQFKPGASMDRRIDVQRTALPEDIAIFMERSEARRRNRELKHLGRNRTTLAPDSTIKSPTACTSDSPDLGCTPANSLQVYKLLTITPSQFALFLSYIYNSCLTESLCNVTDSDPDCTWEALWAFGSKLRSPGFQNHCMDGLRDLKRVRKGQWPTAKEARTVYDLCLDLPGQSRSTHSAEDKDEENAYVEKADCSRAMLKKFTASCIAANAPMSNNPPNTLEYRIWARMFKDNEELSLDVHKVNLKQFGGKNPWDDDFRDEFMIPEQGMMEKWKETLRSGKGNDDIVASTNTKSILGLLAKRVLDGEKDGGDDTEDQSSDED